MEKAKKSLSQNFLIDKKIFIKILKNLEIKNKNGFLGWKDTIKLKNIYNIEKDIRNYPNSQLEFFLILARQYCQEKLKQCLGCLR